jgi:hypothetical protein
MKVFTLQGKCLPEDRYFNLLEKNGATWKSQIMQELTIFTANLLVWKHILNRSSPLVLWKCHSFFEAWKQAVSSSRTRQILNSQPCNRVMKGIINSQAWPACDWVLPWPSLLSNFVFQLCEILEIYPTRPAVLEIARYKGIDWHNIICHTLQCSRNIKNKALQNEIPDWKTNGGMLHDEIEIDANGPNLETSPNSNSPKLRGSVTKWAQIDPNEKLKAKQTPGFMHAPIIPRKTNLN